MKHHIIMKEPEDPDPRTKKHHHAITTVLGIEVEANDPGLHHHDTTVAPGTEAADDPSL
jgi:hypothetical protein